MSAPARLTVLPTSDLRSWPDGVESLNPAKSPRPGLYGEGWQKTHANMLDFLERFGAQARDLGWTDLDLFGVHPQIGTGQVDHCGDLILAAKSAELIAADRINFGNTTCNRAVMSYPRPRGVPNRLSSSGPGSSSQSARSKASRSGHSRIGPPATHGSGHAVAAGHQKLTLMEAFRPSSLATMLHRDW